MTGRSITRRLTTSFAIVMALVLIGGGIGIYVGERFSLDRTLRRELGRQSDEIQRLVERPGTVDDADLADRRDSYVQLLTTDGSVVASTPPLRHRRFLTDTQAARANDGIHTFQRGSITSLNRHSFRIRTEAVTDDGERRIVVVGTRRDARDEALRELVGQLLAFGAASLAITVLVGYWLTRSALEPVEDLRRQADVLYREGGEGTLDVPDTDDEIAALASTFNELLERIQQTVNRERAFASAASHELRTPLTALKAELDLALRSPRTNEELVAAIRDASSDTQRLTKLAEDLLLLRTPDVDIDLTNLDLAEVVTDIATRQDVVAELDSGGAELHVVGNRDLLSRAIANLVENARRHGSPPITIELTATPETVRVTVSDEGPGYPEAFLPRAFEHFSRGPGTRSGTGAGLGLAIVEAIAAAHGGTVGAGNTASGAASWIELPRSGAHPRPSS